jgi:hypothetical protein
MKNWHWLALLVVGCVLFLMKDGLPDFGRPAVNNPLVGRWDEVGSWGYIRFADNGWFRYQVGKYRQEGTYQLLSGSAIEFSIPIESSDLIWKGAHTPMRIQPTVRMDIKERKFFLKGDKLLLDLNGRWVEFEKAKDVSAARDSDSSK